MEKVLARKSKVSDSTAYTLEQMRLDPAVTEKVNIHFRNAHAIAKKGRPFTEIEWFVNLDEAKEQILERHTRMTRSAKSSSTS